MQTTKSPKAGLFGAAQTLNVNLNMTLTVTDRVVRLMRDGEELRGDAVLQAIIFGGSDRVVHESARGEFSGATKAACLKAYNEAYEGIPPIGEEVFTWTGLGW